ncbi:MAG: hypothetical protein WAZ12_02705 [Candidatus Absconditicoccaceae bacterium]
MTTEQLIQIFSKITKDEKILKLQEILNMLKDKLPIFEDMDVYLTNAGNQIEDSTLISYYSIILKNAEYLENKKVIQYQEFMEKLRKIEVQEHLRDDDNLDNDLNNI